MKLTKEQWLTAGAVLYFAVVLLLLLFLAGLVVAILTAAV